MLIGIDYTSNSDLVAYPISTVNSKYPTGVEQEPEYCQMAVKRLNRAESDKAIQGYHDGYFWERNSLARLSDLEL
jgi:hypothetical protein